MEFKKLKALWLLLIVLPIMFSCSNQTIKNQKETYKYYLNFKFDKSLIPNGEVFFIIVKIEGGGKTIKKELESNIEKLELTLRCKTNYLITVYSVFHLAEQQEIKESYTSCFDKRKEWSLKRIVWDK